ncbi:uncharacterized protein LOC126829914 isoform X3 [Patella vulgata]|uniref:uncharacterized protein LOC126829914 isoform X3 n=1 Tax=Patella vulgata TaxID=6465 RepID=UPI00217FAD48|nr:uncharacterized protein LOC126829914 isoform X3 [Patella vulgata]
MPIVPVKVVNGCKIVETYAFNDSGSSVCFCTHTLMYALGLSGKQTSVNLQTMNKSNSMPTIILSNIKVYRYDMSDSIIIKSCYTIDQIPVTKSDVPLVSDISKYPHLEDIDIPELNCDVGLLIGNNVAEAYTPQEYRIGPQGSPHASKTAIGWILWNVLREENESSKLMANRVLSNSINLCAEIEQSQNLDRLVRTIINLDFPERNIDDKKENSVLDERFINNVSDSIILDSSGHYQIDIPFKDNNVVLPKNFNMALDRLESLRRKFRKNQKFHEDYTNFMNSMFEKSYAEEVPKEEINCDNDRLWFIPHHAVVHKQKGKLRVVYDCSAKYRGVSLNDTLLSGPDLTNTLLGVLLRFRLGKIAVMADIEGMFFQVKVPPKQRHSLRFLWWPNGNLSVEPKQYQMTAHLFGAVSSPSCANFALKSTANNNSHRFNDYVCQSVLNDFYVDDLLKSTDLPEDEVVGLVQDLTKLCKLGGFHLHKWISNSAFVQDSIPLAERGKLSQISLLEDDPVIERALGL